MLAFHLWRLGRQCLAPSRTGRDAALGLALRLAAIHLGIVALATWSALALAQPAADPASPNAPASVMAPPKPTPGDGQPQLLRERLVRQAFAQADRNGDGQLSQEEAASIAGLPERFSKADSNRDGLISREEFRAAGGP